MTTETRIASLPDLRYILDASKSATESIGFVPTSKLLWLLERRQVAVNVTNGDLTGFCVHGRTGPVVKIWQLWIQSDARRIEYGTSLVRHVVRTTAEHDVFAIGLRCATDLPAIAFWQEIGFTCVRAVNGGKRRRRRIAIFRRELSVLERLGLDRTLSG